jgi:hypothetical protein
MIRICALVVLLPVCLQAGCAAALERDLRKRAAFDLQCPEEQLQLTPLGNTTFGNQSTPPYGVAGCNKRAAYVYTSGGWVLNTYGGQPLPPVPSPAPSPM